ncbi:MAG: hypothetical protein LBR90_00350, partial [Elusimicrobiota bacterium]|nr:hypothetical protein [Elusimicrobiota bacterium]
MKILKGIAASPGIAIGPAYVVAPQNVVVERKKIPPTNIEWEVRRYKTALERTLEDLNKSEEHMREIFGRGYAKLLQAHKLILKDPLLVAGVIKKIEKEHISAEAALYAAVQEISANFDKIKDDFFRERKFDVADVAKRLLENITQRPQNIFANIKEPSIVIAHNLLPSDTINLKGKKVLGFATDIGGKTSHSALLAQSMQMPAVVGLSAAAGQIKNGELIILDGEKGQIIINPDEAALLAYRREKSVLLKAEKSLQQISPLPNETKDGHKVALYVNYDPRRDAKEWDSFQSEGLGLMRTE